MMMISDHESDNDDIPEPWLPWSEPETAQADEDDDSDSDAENARDMTMVPVDILMNIDWVKIYYAMAKHHEVAQRTYFRLLTCLMRLETVTCQQSIHCLT